jgi:thiol:disulfide interchange protein
MSNPVHWTHTANHIEGDIYELVFKAKIDKEYYTYSMYLEGDDGPIPTSINIESGKASKEGKATESSSDPANVKTMHDQMFDMELKKFKKDIILTQRIKCTDLKTPIEGYVESMACNATSCTPPMSYEFSFDLSKVKRKDVKAENNNPEDPEDKTDEGKTDDANTDEGDADTDKEEEANDEEKPVNWDINIKSLGNQEYEISFTASIADGWHVYSSKLESDEGPIPTSINIEENDNIKLVGEATESTSEAANRKEGKDPLFDNINLIKYKHDLTLVQKVSVKDTTKALKGFLTFMTCNNERCLPPTDIDFNFFETATTDKKEDGNVNTDIKRENIISTLEAANKGEGSCGNETKSNDLSFLMIFIFGFIGGLFALLTPCVFPMVPLTVSFFTKRSKSRAEGIRNALIYGLSIIVIYVALGMSITIIFGDNALNWLSTHWIPNTLFFVMFIAFAISFFGYYEISLPSSWSNNTDRAADRGGLIGIFFMAFTLSLVSFSCTGPIIGTLLVQAAEGGRLAPAIGMLGFSSALALPFALFSAFPGWLNSLPRSGGWMNTVKVVLGFIEVALAFKFLSKADLTMHWNILKYETFMVIYVLSALAMGIYLLGYIRFPHDDKGAKIGIPRKILGVLSIALGAYFATGFMVNPKTETYATPAIMSGLAPPACYSYAHPCDCPAGIQNCFHDYYDGLAYAKERNLPIMIDFTGYGCENCRKMEDQVWVNPDINALINDEYVLISLYVDDREKLAEVKVGPDGTKLRTVGNLWASFERVNFKQQSQPLYVLMAPDETVLNKPVGATFDIQAYKEFLECGVENFNKWKAKQ